MRILVISAMFHSTPPKGYGGIERVVYTLVERLIRNGHEVTLFGTPGSYCSGRTIVIPHYNPLKAPSGTKKCSELVSEEPLYKALCDFLKIHPVDIIHDWSFQNLFLLRHPERFPFIISSCVPPHIGYKRPNLVACSQAHAKLYGEDTPFVHYGLDLDKWEYSHVKKKHIVHISKIASYKGQHLSIKAARKSKKNLLLAGNIEDHFYYYSVIKPLLLISPKIKYIGEIRGTNAYLKEASVLVQTPRWFEAFPLVVLEALASGTPVIALPEGGIPEQITSGVNGFICRTLDDLATAMKNVGEIKSQDCRAYAEAYFSDQRMTNDYIQLYHKTIEGERW